MKKFIYIMAALALVISCGPKEKKGFTISGKMFDYNGYATLGYKDPASEEISADTVKIINGEYSFSGHVSEPCFGQIIFYPDTGYKIRASLVVENYDIVANENVGFMVIDGKNILTARNLYFHGGRNNDTFQAMKESYAYLDDEPEFKGMGQIYEQMNNCGVNDLNKYVELQTSLFDKYGKRKVEKYNRLKNEAILKFIKKNGNTEISAYLLQQCEPHKMPLDELEEAYSCLSKKVQKSNLAVGITSILETRRQEAAK